MPRWHEKFITAIIIIATLSLPLFSDASLGKKGLAAGQNIGLFLSSIGSTLDSAVDSVRQVARNTYHVSRSAYDAISSNAKIKISRQQARLAQMAANQIQRTKSQSIVITRQAENHLMSLTQQMLRRSAATGKYLVWERLPELTSGAASAINPVEKTKDFFYGVKHTALALLNQKTNENNPAPTSDVEEPARLNPPETQDMLHDSQEQLSSAPTHETPPPLHERERESFTHLH